MSARAILLHSAVALAPAVAQQAGDPTKDLDKLSPDERFSVHVSSVGRKTEPLSKAAAVFVPTADDIRRSGATSIPKALQWVPGLVPGCMPARCSFDGRSLYTPLFSGVLRDPIGVRSFSVRNVGDRRVLDCDSQGPTVPVPLRRRFVFQWSQRL